MYQINENDQIMSITCTNYLFQNASVKTLFVDFIITKKNCGSLKLIIIPLKQFTDVVTFYGMF